MEPNSCKRSETIPARRDWPAMGCQSENAGGEQSSTVNGETAKAQDGTVPGEIDGKSENGELEAEEHKVNETEDAVSDDTRKEILIQSLFDMLVLQCSFEVSETTHEDGLRVLESTLESRLELEAASRKRLQQAAKDYWKRTSLLFGLLA